MSARSSIHRPSAKRIYFSLVPLLLAAGFAACSAAAAELEPDRKVRYATAEDSEGKPVKLHLHVFLPEDWKAADRRPAAVFFFGGGWNGGTPEQFYAQCQALAEHGMVAAAAEYRVRSRHGTEPQDCVADGRRAVAFLREHAEAWGIDPARIAAGGGSAGGHVAACTGVLPADDETTRPNLLLLYNPVIDTSPKGYGANRLGDDWRQLSPLHHVRPGLPPTLICHGTADTTTPFAGVEAFQKAMQAAGNRCEVDAYEGRKHGFFNSPAFRKKSDGKDYQSTLKATLNFLAEAGWVKR
ncbi:alpha/beta hydrolase [Roseimaritima sediminicola]|uniref:alpha/beta hydrolase n=1 Tax=Roseimaritima sediminicola TaxID=2662066 RepID=UPI001298334B|nr:alpha/beta hydrolase [Roseimaritima sediminicola]